MIAEKRKSLILNYFFFILTFTFLPCYSLASPPTKKNIDRIKLVSWNIEHLAEKNGEGCKPRNDNDYAQLRNFAMTLDADVIALQEVESKKAISRVFPESDWLSVISSRPANHTYPCRHNHRPSTQQKTAIVIRKAIPFEALKDIKKLSLDIDGLRYGVAIRLTVFEQAIDILTVHLKSGCFINNYTLATKKACLTLQRQSEILSTWIASKLKRKQAFIILGDFNHRLAAPHNQLWQDITQANGEPDSLVNSMTKLISCHPKYPAPIDHILLSPIAAHYQRQGSEMVHFFEKATGSRKNKRPKAMLSDHCPISIELKSPQVPQKVL